MKTYIQRHAKVQLQNNHHCTNCTTEAILERKTFKKNNSGAMTCLKCGGYYPSDCRCGPNCCCDGCNTLWRTREQNSKFYEKLYNTGNEQKMNELYVLDLETTGLDYLYDKILEVAIYKVDFSNYSYKKIYDKVVKQDITQLYIQNCWVVQQNYLTLDEIDHGWDPIVIKEELFSLLSDKQVTSYNVGFDFAFLKKQFNLDLQVPYCLMLESTAIVRLPGYNGDFKWPRLQEAYNYFFDKQLPEKHRAGPDTELAAQIALALHKFRQTHSIIKQAVAEKSYVVINYTDRKNDATYDRKIQPKEFKRGETLIEAFDFLRNENRTFNLIRINKIAMFYDYKNGV